MAQHTNLFGYVDGEGEFYAALQRDFKRDDRIIQIAALAIGIAIFYLFRHLSGLDYLAAIVGGGAAIALVLYQIDQSNRNFLMHMIDWQNARDAAAREAAQQAEWARMDREA